MVGVFNEDLLAVLFLIISVSYIRDMKFVLGKEHR